MGLLVLAGVAALVLTLLVLVTIAIVQLVLLVTLRNTLLALAVVGFYWFVDSRRRQVAKGFYSCTEVPGSGKSAEKATSALTKPTKEKRKDASTPKTSDVKKQSSATVNKQDEAKNTDECERSAPRDALTSEEARGSDGVVATGGVNSFEAEAMPLSSSSDGAESSSDEVKISAAAAETSSPSSSASTSPRSGMQLPGLRRHQWKFPSHSMPLKPKGEALLQHGRRSTGGSASNSPRRPELYGSPRSIAAEQKLMKTALESDGYFIGDFRVPPPPPLPKRSQSLGTRTKAATASTNASNTATYTTHTQRTATASRAV